MRHVILASIGSHGDVFPYVALGRALRARGNRVTLAANEQYCGLATEHQLEFVALVSNEETQAFFSEPDLWHPIKCGAVGARWGRRWLRRQYALLRDLAAPEDTLMASSLGVPAARLVQETLSRPLSTIYHMPWMIPSCTAPPAMTGGLSLPRWAPRPVGQIYWRLVDVVGSQLLGRELNKLRAELGLKPVHRFFPWCVSPDLAIGLFPEWYAKPQPDWPAQLRVAGFPMFIGQTESNLDSRVLEFCQAGQPPIVFTFGTGMLHTAELFRESARACTISRSHGIFLTNRVDQLPERLPPNVCHFAFVPLRQLLPFCAGIVHHGGIGTVAAALSAGTPQLIIPHAWDQLDNARRVIELGAGTMLSRRKCSAARLAKETLALVNLDSNRRCSEIPTQFDGEHAMATAAGWIEELTATRASEERNPDSPRD